MKTTNVSYCAPTYNFIHLPKTGGNSIKRAAGFENTGHQSIEELIRDGDNYGTKCDTAKPFVCFVRDPYDRLVSAWAYSRQANMNNLPATFPRLVKELELHIGKLHLRPQIDWLRTTRNVEIAIYRFENMPTAFADMQLRFGVGGDLAKGNTSRHKGYEAYYDDKLKQIVYDHYLADFLAFGYQK